MTTGENETATMSAFAKRIGTSRQYVGALRRAGRLVLDESGRVKVAESLQRIESTRDPSRPSKIAGDTEPDGYQASRALKEHYLALAAKRDYEKSCGELLVAADVRDAVRTAEAILRTRIEAMAGPLAAALHDVTDEHQRNAVITEHVELALRDLSEQFERSAM